MRRVLVFSLLIACAAGAAELEPEWWKTFDWSDVRGVNYLPSYAYNSLDWWTDYDHDVIDRELGYAEKLNLNSLRIWLHQYAYELDPEGFLAKFEDFLATADKHGLTVMPCVFDGFFTGEQQPPALGLEVCITNPAPAQMAEDRWHEMYPYLDDLVGKHLGDPRIIAWDIMNEPSSLGFPAVAKGDKEYAWNFARAMCDYVNKLDNTHPVTVGVGNHSHIPRIWDHVDLVSVHIYQAFEKSFQIEIDNTKALAKGKPYVLTETTMTEMASNPNLSMRMLRRNDMGWYFCSGIVGKQVLITPHAILTKEGVAFAPDYVAAVLGFPVPAEMQPKRFDGYRIIEIVRNIDTVPTDASNVDEHAHAIRELARCIGWAQVDTGTETNDAVADGYRAAALLAEGKEDEAYPIIDDVLRRLGHVADRYGFFEKTHEPTFSELFEVP